MAYRIQNLSNSSGKIFDICSLFVVWNTSNSQFSQFLARFVTSCELSLAQAERTCSMKPSFAFWRCRGIENSHCRRVWEGGYNKILQPVAGGHQVKATTSFHSKDSWPRDPNKRLIDTFCIFLCFWCLEGAKNRTADVAFFVHSCPFGAT